MNYILILIGVFLMAPAFVNGQPQDELDTNQAKWDSFISGNNSYVMTLKRRCFCKPDYWGPFLIVVNSAGDVASATYLEESEHPGKNLNETERDDLNLMTVQDGFDTIQRAIDEDAYDLDVTYDPVGGYPSKVSIDWGGRRDSSTHFQIENVVPL